MGGPSMRRRRGEDTVHPLKVSLEDTYNGKTARLELSKNVICSACTGKGGKPGSLQTCKECKGCGMKISYRSIRPGLSQQLQRPCGDCMGQGKMINEKDRCTSCKGKCVLNQTKILEVHIDKGMRENQKIYFRGEGDQQPDVETGDVIIVLQQKKHEVFERSGNDLMMSHTISLTEALCGFSVVVQQLDGRELLVKHAAGQVIKPGDLKGVPGEGMPMYKNPFEKGNLYIKFVVNFPENHFLPEEFLRHLETFLPPRPAFVMPEGEHVEEVDLSEYTQEQERSREEAYNIDDDDHMHGAGGPGLQCAHQ